MYFTCRSTQLEAWHLSKSSLQHMLMPGIPLSIQGQIPQEAGLTAGIYASGHFCAAFQVAMAMEQRQGLPRNPVGREHAPKVYLAGCKAFLHDSGILSRVCLQSDSVLTPRNSHSVLKHGAELHRRFVPFLKPA